MTKKWKKLKNPTYLSYLFGACNPQCCTQTHFQVVLINHTSIFPTLKKRWELEFYLFIKRWGRVHFCPKRGEVGKIVEEWRLLRENNLSLIANLCVYKSKNIYIYIYIYILYIPVWTLLVYFRNRHLYQDLACGAHFQFNNHELFENVDWN